MCVNPVCHTEPYHSPSLMETTWAAKLSFPSAPAKQEIQSGLTIVCALCTVCTDIYLAIPLLDLSVKHYFPTLPTCSWPRRMPFRARAPNH